MQFKTLHNIKLKGKIALLRADLNVPVMHGRVDVTEAFRLERVVPTIQFLLKRGARVIILSHRGRPEGKVCEDLRLEPVARRLRQLLNYELGIRNQGIKNHNSLFMIRDSKTWRDLRSLSSIYTIEEGKVWMLENLRFDPREEKNDMKFAKELASLGDIYVNDAFAVSHRKNASVHAITKYLPSYAGLLMEEEISALSVIFKNPCRPLVVVIGGAKISTKIGLIEKFLPHADHVLLGGALANTLLKAQGYAVGKSLVEEKMLRDLRSLDMTNPRLKIPVDIVVAKSVKGQTRIAAAADVRAHEAIFDIGPDTVALFARILSRARMIVWNGPLGFFEEKKFAQSTFAVMRAALQNTRATIIIGGGETVTAFRQFQHDSRFTFHDSRLFLSTGGGAMLEYLEKGTLPSLDPLLR